MNSSKNLIFVHTVYPFGGTEKITSIIGKELAERGYNIYILSLHFDEDLMSEKDLETFKCIQLPSKKKSSDINRDFIREFIQDKDIAAIFLPDIFFRKMNTIVEGTRTKLVCALHAVPFWEIVSKELSAKRRSKESVSKFLIYWLLRFPKYKILKTHHRQVINRYKQVHTFSDCYVVLCQEYKEYLEKQLGLNQDSTKITVIPNPSLYGEFIPEQKQTKILYCGRLSFEDKRVDKLLQIWNKIYDRYPDWELQIVGDGPDRKELERYVKQNNIKRATFYGFCQDPAEFYKKASIVCFTSQYEGWGLALAEGAANGTVPIAYDCSAGLHYVISENGKNGFLIENNNQDEYIRKLELLMSNAEVLRSMQQYAFANARQSSASIIAEQWIEMLQRLCK